MKPDDAEELLAGALARLDLRDKVALLTGADYWTVPGEPKIGLRPMVTSDGPAGVRGARWDERDTAANVPSPAALASTWDEECVELIGELLAADCRRKGVDILLAPTVNLHRTPYGGRHFECFSEDPFLSGKIGAALVRGLQAQGVAATVKHFVANDSETQRFTVDVRIDERTLRELYMAPFEVIVEEARPWAVMAAYNGVNGHTMTESPLLQQVLKDEWGFDGVVVSDWHAGRTTEPTALAGLDLLMPGPRGPWGSALVDAVEDGRVAESAIDDKVLRLLRLAARVGALDGRGLPRASPELWPDIRISRELRATTADTFVLTRNESSLLPLDVSALRRVAVVGPNAVSARTLGGGSATVFPPYSVSPLGGIRAAFGSEVAVDYSPGVRSHTQIPRVPTSMLHLPGTGEPGALVEFLDADGRVLHSEVRYGGFYTWRMLPDGVSSAELASVRVSAAVRAETAGEHLIGCSGQGRFRMTIAGSVAFESTLSVAPGTDPTAAYMKPPQEFVPVMLETGQPADIILEHYLDKASGATSFVLGGVSFQLNTEAPFRPDDEEIERAVDLARDADVAIVVVGTTEEVESEGFDRTSLILPGRQDELVRRIASANPRIIVVVNSGAPVLLPWFDEVGAVLITCFPGQEFGNALADVLIGVREPGGRLPTTWPASTGGLPSTKPRDGVLSYDEGLFVGYKAFDRDGRSPMYPFGHGLGYTEWQYISMDVDGAASGDGVVARVGLRNVGRRPGRETVQLYASRSDSAVERPARWLVGFAKVEAAGGTDVAVDIVLPWRRFAHWDTAVHGWAVEPGEFQISAGRSSRDLRLEARLVRR